MPLQRRAAQASKAERRPFYEARVALDPGQPELADLKLQSGMPAEVMIITGKRTALDYLLKPILASLGRALREE